MPTIRASKFLPPFESAGFVVMAKRAVSRERERSEKRIGGDLSDPEPCIEF